MSQENCVIGLDIGTTNVRSILYDNEGEIKGSSKSSVDLITEQPGQVEIDPEALWTRIKKVLSDSIEDSGLNASQISGIGISCQRSSFITWNRETGKPYHNLITWKDLRASGLVKEWNNSWSLGGLRIGGKILHGLSRMPRWKAASIYKMQNETVPMRLLWALEHVEGLKEDAKNGEVMFGCVDTWLIHKLTGNHVIEFSNAAATGFFDPFSMRWADWLFKLLHIPMSILPTIVDSSGDHFGSTLEDLLGVSVPIRAVLADQSASAFGSGCFEDGSAKLTMGTGSFLDVITLKPHASMNGLYPLVAWKIGEEIVFMAEGSVSDTGGMIQWAEKVGLFQDIGKLSEIVSGLDGSGGVYCVPGFNGLKAPVSDPAGTAGFIGIGFSTTKEEMLRALLESIAFNVKQIVEAFLSETNYKFSKLMVDGGVSQNDFILQQIASLTSLPVVRCDKVEMSAWGVASLAGIQAGMWKDRQQVAALRRSQEEFVASNKDLEDDCLERFDIWREACLRFGKWHKM